MLSEAGRCDQSIVMQYSKKASIAVLLTLAYQSFGVVYGDLSVSPLYVFRATFGGRLHYDVEEHDVMAVLSFIFWTLTLIPVVKYSFIVLCAHDNGEGTTTTLFFYPSKYSHGTFRRYMRSRKMNCPTDAPFMGALGLALLVFF